MKRMIKLLELLRTRSHVTMNTIVTECQIPERTVFRYLNTLSEGNIPLYYDKYIKAYKLAHKPTSIIDILTIEENLYLLMSLKLFSKMLDSAYSSDINQLYEKLLGYQNIYISEICEQLDEKIKNVNFAINFTEELHLLLINLGINMQKGLELKSNLSSTKTVISQPSLLFRKQWQLRDKDALESDISIDSIEKVKIS